MLEEGRGMEAVGGDLFGSCLYIRRHLGLASILPHARVHCIFSYFLLMCAVGRNCRCQDFIYSLSFVVGIWCIRSYDATRHSFVYDDINNLYTKATETVMIISIFSSFILFFFFCVSILFLFFLSIFLSLGCSWRVTDCNNFKFPLRDAEKTREQSN